MSYLGLDLNTLIWEIESLMKNNYNGLHKDNLESNFYLAKKDILETFGDLISQNKEEVFKELKEDLK